MKPRSAGPSCLTQASSMSYAGRSAQASRAGDAVVDAGEAQALPEPLPGYCLRLLEREMRYDPS